MPPSASKPSHRRAERIAGAVLLHLAALTAQAQADGETPTVVIVGTGAEQRAFDTPYAASVVPAAALRSSGPMVNISEALGRVPGLVANLRHNYAQDLQISSRGFGARASFGVRGIRLLADGIPAAGPDGQGQVSHFDLAGADRIEVLRGPFSALYGSSSGGVIALVSRDPAQAEAEWAADIGSHGLAQGRLSLARPLGDGWSLRATGSHFETEGFRPQSAARKSLANLRVARSTASERLVLVLNALHMPAQDPLGLTRAQFDANPDQTAALATQFDTRKNTRQFQGGLQWQHRFDGEGALRSATLMVYQGTRSVTQWQSIAPATQAPARHPGGVIDFDRDYGGLDARIAWRAGALNGVLGLAIDEQREERRGYENFLGAAPAQQLGVTGRLRRDERNRARSGDAFAQAELSLSPELGASVGWRSGRLRVVSVDHFLGNGDDSGALSFGYTLPVAALRWQPQEQLSLYVSAGRGFEAPTLNELAYRPDGGAGFNTALRPQTSTQWELGAKWRAPAARVSADLAVFEARTGDEIGVNTNAGGRSTFRNVGRTLRRGLELSAGWRFAAQWRAQAAATWLDARYRDGFLTCSAVPCTAPTVSVAAGRRIAGTLPRSAFAELVHLRGPFEWALEARAQGRQPVNDLNSDHAAGHGLLALRALGRWSLGGGQFEALARIDNLADRRAAASVIVNEANQRFFEQAPGRTFLLSLRWRHGF